MFASGAALAVFGGLAWLLALMFEKALPGTNVINLDLLWTRQSMILVGGFSIVSGCVLMAASQLLEAIKNMHLTPDADVVAEPEPPKKAPPPQTITAWRPVHLGH